MLKYNVHISSPKPNQKRGISEPLGSGTSLIATVDVTVGATGTTPASVGMPVGADAGRDAVTRSCAIIAARTAASARPAAGSAVGIAGIELAEGTAGIEESIVGAGADVDDAAGVEGRSTEGTAERAMMCATPVCAAASEGRDTCVTLAVGSAVSNVATEGLAISVTDPGTSPAVRIGTPVVSAPSTTLVRSECLPCAGSSHGVSTLAVGTTVTVVNTASAVVSGAPDVLLESSDGALAHCPSSGRSLR